MSLSKGKLSAELIHIESAIEPAFHKGNDRKCKLVGYDLLREVSLRLINVEIIASDYLDKHKLKSYEDGLLTAPESVIKLRLKRLHFRIVKGKIKGARCLVNYS